MYAETMSSKEGGMARSALVLEDPGTTDNLITHKLAAALRLPSAPLTLSPRALGQKHESKQLQAYVLYLFDMTFRPQELISRRRWSEHRKYRAYLESFRV